jgi:hypothetical protein
MHPEIRCLGYDPNVKEEASTSGSRSSLSAATLQDPHGAYFSECGPRGQGAVSFASLCAIPPSGCCRDSGTGLSNTGALIGPLHLSKRAHRVAVLCHEEPGTKAREETRWLSRATVGSSLESPERGIVRWLGTNGERRMPAFWHLSASLGLAQESHI